MLVKTYDILNAGPRNRFMANGKLVSNSGVRVQVQNLIRDAFGNEDEVAEVNNLSPKKNKKEVHALADACITTAVQVGRSGDADIIRLMYERQRKDSQGRLYTETVMHWISRMLRRVICAPAGYTLLNGDFAQIEARIPNWLAGQRDVVEAFAQGKDVYRMQAAPIYNVKPEELTHEQRQLGKVCVLFLGFAGGENAFIPAAMNYGMSIPLPMAQNIVKVFREKNNYLTAYWDELLWCAIQAVMSPGCVFSVKPTHLISWCMEGDCLLARLPSGRCLRYWQPRLEQGYWKDGKPKPMPDLTVLQVKGRAVLRRTLWRGLTIENCLAADTVVLTDSGCKELHLIMADDLVWDGLGWVSHGGVVVQGVRETIGFGGVRMTPDHKVYVGDTARPCAELVFDVAARAYAEHFHRPYAVAKPRENGPFSRNTGRFEPVYDIVNAGPNHRFTVVGRDGRLILVSNCTQAIAADMLVTALANLHDAGLPVVLHVHDAAAAEVPERDAEKLLPVFEQCMLAQHAWTAGLPVAVAAHASPRFG